MDVIEDTQSVIEVIKSHPGFTCVMYFHDPSAIDWPSSSFASKLSKDDLNLLQNMVIQSGIPLAIGIFARDVSEADKELLQSSVILLSEAPGYVWALAWFATNVRCADIPLLQAAVIASNDTQGMNRFAQSVEDADIDILQAAIITSKDFARSYALGQFAIVKGADIPRIQSELIASGDLGSLRDLVNGACNNGYKKAKGVDVNLVVDAMKKHIYDKTYKSIHDDDLHANQCFIKSFEMQEAAKKRIDTLRFQLSENGNGVLLDLYDNPGHIDDLEVLIEGVINILCKMGFSGHPFSLFVINNYNATEGYSRSYVLNESVFGKDSPDNYVRLGIVKIVSEFLEKSLNKLFKGCLLCGGQNGEHGLYCEIAKKAFFAKKVREVDVVAESTIENITDSVDSTAVVSLMVYDRNFVVAKHAAAAMEGGSRDCTARLTSNLAKMLKLGGIRKLGLVAVDYKSAIIDLRRDYPNFGKVIDFYEGVFALAMLDGGIITSRPILLNGAAGIGKTSFASRIAKIIQTSFQVVPMATTDTGSELGGSSAYWTNTSPGKVFDALVWGEYANPVILVDEIDKAPVVIQHTNPLSALYTLLEKDTAKKFTDQSIDVPLDASNVIWVFTSNETHCIPDAIMSRLSGTVFDVPSPTREETLAIAASIYRSLLSEYGWGKHFPNELSNEMLKNLCIVSPREIKNGLLSSFGVAAKAERTELLPADFQAGGKRVKIGFSNV